MNRSNLNVTASEGQGRLLASGPITGCKNEPSEEPQRSLVQQIAWQSRKHGKRVFWFLGLRSYNRLDGTPTMLAYWQGDCVVCGAKFEIATPQGARSADSSKDFQVMTCALHRGKLSTSRKKPRKTRPEGRGFQRGAP
jgi:hypothetical protein